MYEVNPLLKITLPVILNYYRLDVFNCFNLKFELVPTSKSELSALVKNYYLNMHFGISFS